jgi:hypothetical protein
MARKTKTKADPALAMAEYEPCIGATDDLCTRPRSSTGSG